MSKILEVENLVKKYGDNYAVKNVSFSVNEGEVLAIIGSSGSGKSTVLRCINQLEKIDGGNIKICGDSMIKELKTENKLPKKYNKKNQKVIYADKDLLNKMNLECGMVFQNFNLFPHLSVLDNVTEAMIQVLKKSKDEAEKEGIKILTRMGIESKINQYPCNLSGGEQQRASIARTLAINPKIIFMDEPTSALDPELVGEVLKVVKQLASEKRTMVIVTHEISFAREIADRVIFMSKGEIIEEGKPEEVIDNPKKDRTKEFLKRYLK